MSGRQKGSQVQRDSVVTTGLDDLIANAAKQDASFQAAAEDTEAQLALLHHLAKMRRRKRLSQTEVARRMDTKQSAVSELEKGIVEPRLSTLQRYARVLGYRLWLVPVKAPHATYTDRHFHYPSPPKLSIKARKAAANIPDAPSQSGAAQATKIGNVHFVHFRRRDMSPLGGSLADRLNNSAAA